MEDKTSRLLKQSKNNFVSYQELYNQLAEIENLRNNLSSKFSLLSQSIRYLFGKIKECESIDQAKEYLELLDVIESQLLKFIFEDKIGIPERLDRFAREFDRFGQDKRDYFKKIKNNEIVF